VTLLASFFSTFKASDWVTAALAVAALVLSIVSITQKSRRLPTPLLIVNVWFARRSDHDPTNWVIRSIENKGSEVAHDVWVYLYHAEKPKFDYL
jgi:hypothetical protein